MSTLIPIREPGATAAAGPSWRAFLELGFRPLYLAGASWALVSVLIWIFVPHWAGGELAGLPWHAHEMLWGFVATIAIGFLLTAGANWTGITPLAGPPLGALLALWAAARVGYLLPQPSALWAAAAAEFLFFAIAAAATLATSVQATPPSPSAALLQCGGYLDRLPKDPWGNEYQYLQPGTHGAVDIFSLGADGQPGGEDVNADIGNWNLE